MSESFYSVSASISGLNGMCIAILLLVSRFRLRRGFGFVMWKITAWRSALGYLVSIALTLAGALGNIIDCVFYGVIYDYAPLLYGKVIDMFYFPLITNRAGEVIFFRPVFNFADSCITVAVFIIFLFYRKDFDLSLHKFHEDI